MGYRRDTQDVGSPLMGVALAMTESVSEQPPPSTWQQEWVVIVLVNCCLRPLIKFRQWQWLIS